MPACCIKQCGARKNQNQPELSLHRFPRNERLKKKWLEAIDEENINPRLKERYLCSLHFEQSCFNRTLDVIRLRDNSVPTIFLASKKEPQQKSPEMSHIQKLDVSCISIVMPPSPLPYLIKETVHQEVIHPKKLNDLAEKCAKQQRKIKSLHEMVRRKNKKIANLKDIIKDLQRKKCINVKKVFIIKKLAGPKDCLKGQR